MRRRLGPMVFGWIVFSGVVPLALRARADAPAEFQVRFEAAVAPMPFTGRVYVMVSRRELKELPVGPNWFNPEPLLARDVKDWKAGEILTIGDKDPAFPSPLSTAPKGTYWALAVMDLDRGERSFAAAAGNLYSKAVRFDWDPAVGGRVPLTIDQVYRARPFAETDRVKLVDIESKLLSAFQGRMVRLRAGVVLPESFALDRTRCYPVVYEIPGFGGTHTAAAFRRNATNLAGVEVLHVVLDPSCRSGHHVFADSANNGPCGQALVEELIPHIEREYRALALPAARFVTGHSSGGWSSLWLQITYPDFFGGVWSTAPDPVDFRDFQRVNIYQADNIFVDEQGNGRPLARRQGKPFLYYKPFSDMEEVMGHGGQLGAFEAVFSPRGPDGKPVKLWDRRTGKIDPAVALSWQKYDIRMIVEKNWKSLGPRLTGKVHVYMGGEDTFYLDGATALLKESLGRLGSDAVVEIFPGKDHGSLMDRALRERIAGETATAIRKHFPG